jgi:hypothetical protein
MTDRSRVIVGEQRELQKVPKELKARTLKLQWLGTSANLLLLIASRSRSTMLLHARLPRRQGVRPPHPHKRGWGPRTLDWMFASPRIAVWALRGCRACATEKTETRPRWPWIVQGFFSVPPRRRPREELWRPLWVCQGILTLRCRTSKFLPARRKVFAADPVVEMLLDW